MSNKIYTPGQGNAPFGNVNLNPEGSAYGVDSRFSAEESALIRKHIYKKIFDAAPAQFSALKLLMAKPMQDVNNDEFEYYEKTFGRSALVVDGGFAGVAAQAGVVGAQQNATIELELASMDHVSKDMLIVFPDNSKAVVQQVIAPNQIVVGSYSNQGLPAVAASEVISFQSTIEADGMDDFSHFSRLETIKRYNYIQQFMRVRRWTRMELQKHMNSGTTSYLQDDREEKIKQLRVDLFASYWNGDKGEVTLANGLAAKTMGGIFPSMVEANSATANPTVAGLKVAFESLLFATNYKQEGATRFVYGTDEMLYNFSKIYKQDGLRYEPNNEIANLKLKRIEIGTQNLVLVPCELWRENSVFPDAWKNRIIVLDQDTVTPVKMKGIPATEMGTTLKRGKNGTRENFQDFWCGAQLSLKFNNPLGSFYIDVQ